MVDLGDPAIAGHHQNERFVARVCTAAERSRLADAADPKSLLWTLFAAKEAAYKVVAKLGATPGFAHRAFEVAPDATTVRYADVDLLVRIDASPERIHAVAASGPGPITSHAAPTPPGEHPSIAARRLLCAAVAERLQCAADELDVIRDRVPGSWDGFGPPRIHRGDAPVPADVSLSHDGRFIAFAVSA